MLPTRSLLLAIAVLFTASCKPGNKAVPSGAPSASASSASASVPSRPAVVATDVKLVRCALGDVTAKPAIKTELNPIGATRSLYLGPDRSLYFFPDHYAPVRLEPTEGGCGYRMAAPLVPAPGSDFGLDPDGSFSQYSETNRTPLTKCRMKAVSELRYGRGKRVGARFLYNDQGALMSMDLDREDCVEKEVSLPELPKNIGSVANFGLAGDDLLIAVGKSDWSYSKEVFRYDPAGGLVKRYGAKEGKARISGIANGCGDGLCVMNGSSLDIHNRDGELVKQYNLGALLKLEKMINLAGVADVPGKGVYALIGHYPAAKGNARAELVRVDGVY